MVGEDGQLRQVHLDKEEFYHGYLHGEPQHTHTHTNTHTLRNDTHSFTHPLHNAYNILMHTHTLTQHLHHTHGTCKYIAIILYVCLLAVA